MQDFSHQQHHPTQCSFAIGFRSVIPRSITRGRGGSTILRWSCVGHIVYHGKPTVPSFLGVIVPICWGLLFLFHGSWCFGSKGICLDDFSEWQNISVNYIDTRHQLTYNLFGVVFFWYRGWALSGKKIIINTRWAPTSYKWSYNPYKWPYK